jgi:NAD-dependent dihydropyrimidine dehydrogenase PreA subunit
MYIVSVNSETCEGCGECVDTCPVTVFVMNSDKKAEVGDSAEECIGCESCVTICSSQSITLQEF